MCAVSPAHVGAWGYRSDGDAGLMLVGARYYDAQAGRFVTRDTLLSEHPYLYCEHEPVGCVDPSGHVAVLLTTLVGAAVGLGATAAVDYAEDGHLNRPWWHYGIGGAVGAGVGALVGAVSTAMGPAGLAIVGYAVRIGLHPAEHYFPEFGQKLPHLQINWWRVGVKASGHVWRYPFRWYR
ncbi:MAG: hypothetical protein IT208_11395 [Chthonomonadales bacterium]|nr:hypothetical protein [Chthonomonadales bacterium]